MGWLSFVMSAFFFISAALQRNDPDPLVWIAIYIIAGMASLLAALAIRGSTDWMQTARFLTGSIGLIALAAALLRARSALPHLTLVHLFESMKAETPAIEESRELFGLLLIAAWNAALFLWLRRPSQKPTPRGTA
jgi:hypothetical protein